MVRAPALSAAPALWCCVVRASGAAAFARRRAAHTVVAMAAREDADGGLQEEVLAKHGHSAQPESQQVVAVLHALIDVIDAERLPRTPTSFFAAGFAALDKQETRSSAQVKGRRHSGKSFVGCCSSCALQEMRALLRGGAPSARLRLRAGAAPACFEQQQQHHHQCARLTRMLTPTGVAGDVHAAGHGPAARAQRRAAGQVGGRQQACHRAAQAAPRAGARGNGSSTSRPGPSVRRLRDPITLSAAPRPSFWAGRRETQAPMVKAALLVLAQLLAAMDPSVEAWPTAAGPWATLLSFLTDTRAKVRAPRRQAPAARRSPATIGRPGAQGARAHVQRARRSHGSVAAQPQSRVAFVI